MDSMTRPLRTLVAGLLALATVAPAAGAQRPRKIFISVDMEGIGGIGT